MKGIVIGVLALWVGLAGVPMALAVEEELPAIPVTVAAAPDQQAFEAGKTLLSLG